MALQCHQRRSESHRDLLTLMVTFPLVILRMLKPTVGIMSSLNWPDCRTTDRQTESFNTVYIWCDWDLLHHRPNIPAAPQQVLMWLTAAKHLNLCTDEPPEQVCVCVCWILKHCSGRPHDWTECQMLIGWETGFWIDRCWTGPPHQSDSIWDTVSDPMIL